MRGFIRKSMASYALESEQDRDQRLQRLFERISEGDRETIDRDSLEHFFQNRYDTLDRPDVAAQDLVDAISRQSKEPVDLAAFSQYMRLNERVFSSVFDALDTKHDGYLDREEIKSGLERLGLDVDESKLDRFFTAVDLDHDGSISYADWRYHLMFVPPALAPSPLQAAYEFLVEHGQDTQDPSLEPADTLHGLGYFLAGGLAGVVSRTCTAPFDRLKVFLIAHSDSDEPPKTPANSSSKASSNSSKVSSNSRVIAAIKTIWSRGGVRAFFVGNGLNVAKVFPESAMKFGSFEATKRFMCRLEGVSDPSELSRSATFLAGGIAGMVSQFAVYPIDTLKFRTQCEAEQSSYKGRALIRDTLAKMWADGGLRPFYRGIVVGVCGVFPFAALDLGTFSAMKTAYVTSRARTLGLDPSEVEIGNMVVLTMGALSGSVGASVVYPINLLRTRLQTQGTSAHPYRYTGFMDVYRQTVARDGFRGLFRGLVPNLAKVAPSVSISYLVYENAKRTLNLE